MLKESAERLSREERVELEGLVLELWRETLSASRQRLVKGVFECRGCGKQNLVEVPVEVPDIVARARAFEVFANQAYGRPEDVRSVTVDVGARTLAALQALSSAELAAIAGEVVEAEFAELPAAAIGPVEDFMAWAAEPD